MWFNFYGGFDRLSLIFFYICNPKTVLNAILAVQIAIPIVILNEVKNLKVVGSKF